MSTRNTTTDTGTAPVGLKAGVARSDITTDAPGAAIHDRLYARALVLDDGATKLAMVTMDVTAIGGRRISCGMLPDVSEEFLPALRERVEHELGIPGRHVLVNASHTHPPGKMLCDDQAQIDRTFDAIRRAMENLTAVRIGVGVGRESRITMNRNLQLRDGRHWTIRHANPCPPNDEVAGVGPLDPQIGILRLDRLDGRPLAVVYNFASHLLFGDPLGKITANFVGVASRVIEQQLGEGAMAMFVQGAAGDVIDVDFKDLSRPRNVEKLGLLLGHSTLDALPTANTGRAGLGVVSRTVLLPRRTDIPARVAALQQEEEQLLESLRSTTLNFESFLPLYLRHGLNPGNPADYSYRYLQAASLGSDEMTVMDAFNRRLVEKYLQNIRAMEKLARIREDIATLLKHQKLNAESGESSISAEIQGIRIGDFYLIAAPIEVLTEVSLNVKRASPHKFTFIAGFSNGYMHYGPPAANYDKGGYEVVECLLAPQWQGIFERTALEILSQL